MNPAPPAPRKVPKWLVTPGVFVLLAVLLGNVPSASASTNVVFPSSQTITTGTQIFGSFTPCIQVEGDWVGGIFCAYEEIEDAGGNQTDFTLTPCCGLFQPQLWVTSGSANGCNIGSPWNCINEIPNNANTTYNFTEYCPVFLPPDPACSFLQYWNTNGTDHYVVQPCSSTPGCGPISPNANITLTEYAYGTFVDTVNGTDPTLGLDVYVSGTQCDPNNTSSSAVTTSYTNISDSDGLPNCTIDIAALDDLEIGIRGMCVTQACDELRNTQAGINVAYTMEHFGLNVSYTWTGLSRTVPTTLRLSGAIASGGVFDTFNISLYNWTAGTYDSIGAFTNTSGGFDAITFVPLAQHFSGTGQLRVRFIDENPAADVTDLYLDYAAVVQIMPNPTPLPSPLLDWMLILLLLILWVSFCAIGAAKSSGLLFMGGSLCGIILAFFFVLPAAELPGIAVLGLAMTCMLGGVGIAISSGGEAG